MTLCLSCAEFYGVEEQDDLCSRCYIDRLASGNSSSLLLLAEANRIQNDININLCELFADFCHSDRLKFTTVSDGQFGLLINRLSHLTAGEITACLRGLRDYSPALALTAKQANQLLTACSQHLLLTSYNDDSDGNRSNDNDDSQLDRLQQKNYSYVHAIIPYIIDPWNLHRDCKMGDRWGSLINCYYIAERSRITPSNYGQLYELWQIFITGNYYERDLDYTICECEICLDDINNKSATVECCQCHQFYHKHCIEYVAETAIDLLCPNCRYQWSNSHQHINDLADFRSNNFRIHTVD